MPHGRKFKPLHLTYLKTSIESQISVLSVIFNGSMLHKFNFINSLLHPSFPPQYSTVWNPGLSVAKHNLPFLLSTRSGHPTQVPTPSWNWTEHPHRSGQETLLKEFWLLIIAKGSIQGEYKADVQSWGQRPYKNSNILASLAYQTITHNYYMELKKSVYRT